MSENTEAVDSIEAGIKDLEAEVERKAIDSYRHYMSVRVEDLTAEYLSASLRENREVSKALEMAAKDRLEEVEGAMMETEGGDS